MSLEKRVEFLESVLAELLDVLTDEEDFSELTKSRLYRLYNRTEQIESLADGEQHQ